MLSDLARLQKTQDGSRVHGSVRDYASRLARLAMTSLTKNRLKNRFSFIFSNGDLLQVLDFAGAPGTIRTPAPKFVVNECWC